MLALPKQLARDLHLMTPQANQAKETIYAALQALADGDLRKELDIRVEGDE